MTFSKTVTSNINLITSNSAGRPQVVVPPVFVCNSPYFDNTIWEPEDLGDGPEAVWNGESWDSGFLGYVLLQEIGSWNVNFKPLTLTFAASCDTDGVTAEVSLQAEGGGSFFIGQQFVTLNSTTETFEIPIEQYPSNDDIFNFYLFTQTPVTGMNVACIDLVGELTCNGAYTDDTFWESGSGATWNGSAWTIADVQSLRSIGSWATPTFRPSRILIEVDGANAGTLPDNFSIRVNAGDGLGSDDLISIVNGPIKVEGSSVRLYVGILSWDGVPANYYIEDMILTQPSTGSVDITCIDFEN